MVLLGGYVVAVRTSLAEWQGEGLPDPFLTISRCLMDDVPRPEITDWYTDRTEAERALEAFGRSAELLAVGLSQEHANALAEYGETFVELSLTLLGRHVPMPTDAGDLGHEIVGCENISWFHSWHCHDYAGEVASALGVRTNDLGLIDDPADADRTLQWMLSRPPDQAPEPLPWTVVTLARCSPRA